VYRTAKACDIGAAGSFALVVQSHWAQVKHWNSLTGCWGLRTKCRACGVETYSSMALRSR